MLSEEVIKEVLEALSNAGLRIAEAGLIESYDTAVISDHKYIIGRIEETGGLGP